MFGDDIEVAERWLSRDPDLDRAVHDAANEGDAERALGIVARARRLPRDYAALLRAEIALALFGQHRDSDALALAVSVNEQVHGAVGMAPWVGGLSAWRLGRFDLARSLFDAAYRAPQMSRARRAGAAYWSARVSLLTSGHNGPWLERAAREPRTFYGLLARRTLGQPIRPEPSFEHDTLAEADVDAVAATLRGRRALALLQVGLPGRASAELRLLAAETREQPGYSRSILLVARAALPELARPLGDGLQPFAVRVPPEGLRPAGGFQLDPALVYALARVESNFDPGRQPRPRPALLDCADPARPCRHRPGPGPGQLQRRAGQPGALARDHGSGGGPVAVYGGAARGGDARLRAAGARL